MTNLFRSTAMITLLLALLALGYHSTQAQNITQTVRGTVIDAQSRSPLIGANVLVMETNPPIGATTDLDGNFRIENVGMGRVSLQVSYLGYNTAVMSNIVVTSGKEVVLDIALEEKVISGKEIVVSASSKNKDKALNEMATISARTFSVEEASRYAGSLNDPARRAANYAGVNGSNDQRNDIIIRGNSPTGVLWRLEGMDIPNPNHFAAQGTNGGPVSILNNNLLTNSDFLTGAFPAEYGNSLSGVFDLKMRKGNNEKQEFVGQMGFNGAELLAEGPISKANGSSYLVSYRYSTLDIFDKIGIDFGTAGIPKYQDLSFKLRFPTENYGIINVFGIGGMSDIALLDSQKEETDNSFGVGKGRDARFGSDMGVVGISHTYFFNNTTYQRLTLGASGQRRSTLVDSLSIENHDPFQIYTDDSKYTTLTANYVLNKKFNSKNTMRSGVIYEQRGFDLNEQVYVNELQSFRDLRSFQGSTGLLQGYTQWRYAANDQLTITPGLHSQYYFLNNTYAVEPRLGMRYKLTDNQSLSFGYGFHNQLQMPEIYFYETRLPDGSTIRTNEDLKFTNSHHVIMGYDHSFSPDLRLKAETYFQYVDNVPVHGNQSSSFSAINLGTDYVGLPALDSLTNGGSGTNYGLELTLEKFFSNNYYFLVTSSLYNSQYKGSDGVQRNTIFNGNYVFNVLAGKEFQINDAHTIVLDGRVVYAGGKRYTPIDLEQSILQQQQVMKTDEAFSLQMDPYFRTDIKLSYRWNMKNVTHEWAFDVQNVFNTQNILMQTFNTETGQLDNEYQLGLFPVFQYRIQF